MWTDGPLGALWTQQEQHAEKEHASKAARWARIKLLGELDAIRSDVVAVVVQAEKRLAEFGTARLTPFSGSDGLTADAVAESIAEARRMLAAVSARFE